MNCCCDCACFHKNLSAVSNDFPARSGCIEAFTSRRAPADRKTVTPMHFNQIRIHFTEADTPAEGCADFTQIGKEVGR